MAVPQEKQGYLGDLSKKTMEELQDLLTRQQNLASNIKFLNRLPDKGAKIKDMISKIQKALEDNRKVDETADLFENLAIQSEQSRTKRQGGEIDEQIKTNEDELLRRLATRGQDTKVVVDQRSELIKDPKVMNSYEKVMKRVEKRPPKNKFIPSRSLKTKDVSELVSKMDTLQVKKDIVTLEPKIDAEGKSDGSERLQPQSEAENSTNTSTHRNTSTSSSSSSPVPKKLSDSPQSASSGDPTEHRGKLRYKYDELLEEKLYSGESHCPAAKIINVEDSITLLKQQQRKLEEIQAKHAAKKLAERLNIKMEAFIPEGSSTNCYRDVEGQDIDSDDEEDELNYPD